MYENFTISAHKVLTLAHEKAMKCYTEPEHLLYGIMKESSNTLAVNVLKDHNVTLGAVDALLTKNSGFFVPRCIEETQPTVSPALEQTLKDAEEYAKRLKHNYIGTEHLLLALANFYYNQYPPDLFEDLDLDPQAIIYEVHELLGYKPSTISEKPYDNIIANSYVIHPQADLIHEEHYTKITDDILRILAKKGVSERQKFYSITARIQTYLLSTLLTDMNRDDKEINSPDTQEQDDSPEPEKDNTQEQDN